MFAVRHVLKIPKPDLWKSQWVWKHWKSQAYLRCSMARTNSWGVQEQTTLILSKAGGAGDHQQALTLGDSHFETNLPSVNMRLTQCELQWERKCQWAQIPFLQHRELMLERQDFVANYFLKKMEEKRSSLASHDGWAKFECALNLTYKLHVEYVFSSVQGNLMLCPLPREAVHLGWKCRVSPCNIAAKVSEYYVGCAGTHNQSSSSSTPNVAHIALEVFSLIQWLPNRFSARDLYKNILLLDTQFLKT